MISSQSLQGKKVYFDANLFIYAFEKTEKALEGQAALLNLFSMLSMRQLDVHSSVLTKLEVLIQPLRHQLTQLENDYRLLLSGQQGVTVHPITNEVLELATLQRATNGFKLADAIHAATAIHAQCDYLITADKGFLRVGPQIRVLLLNDFVNA
jgi:predicted nucleic acid-binding protein